MHTFYKQAYLALIGGTLYVSLETLWRGYTHWSMALVGGLCFLLILALSRRLPVRAGLLARGVAGACAVTAVELCSGAVLNLWLGLGVWDYSSLPGNLWGQVCPLFSLCWTALSIPAVLLGEYLKCRFFGEPRRRYPFLATAAHPAGGPPPSSPTGKPAPG